MEKTKISATVVAHSKHALFGHEIVSIEAVFPRFILAELNTHRMFSRNSASSRAIPAKKMVEIIKNDPFVPIAWQKEHKGMQGTEYHDSIASRQFEQEWLILRNMVVTATEKFAFDGVTKQVANRPLEAFMWHKCIITATEWENFFSLRCPQYELEVGVDSAKHYFKSRKEYKAHVKTLVGDQADDLDRMTELNWLELNKGQAEIHMMALAEAIYDAINESTPRILEPGHWHIPYNDKITELLMTEEGLTHHPGLADLDMHEIEDTDSDTIITTDLKVQMATTMCARVSYSTIGDEKEVTVKKLLEIHDRLIKADPLHASPMEHCNRAMTGREYDSYVKGQASYINDDGLLDFIGEEFGWCRNMRGFTQYRHILEENLAV